MYGISFKRYLLITVVVAIILFGMQTLVGSQVIMALDQLKGTALSVGMASAIASVIVDPIRLVFTSGIPGVLVFAVLWPITWIWLALLVLLFFYATLGSGISTAGTTIR